MTFSNCKWMFAAKAMAFAIFASMGALSAQARLGVTVTGGGASSNLLDRMNVDFEKGISGWRNTCSNEIYCVEEDGRGKAVFCPGEKKALNKPVRIGILKKGRSYILSCDIKPSPKVTTARVGEGIGGLGCSFTVWSADWKQAKAINCRSAGPEKWFRISSKPVEIPEWATHANLNVGVNYSPGHGLVDNIELVEAGGGIDVSVKSDGAPIRQVKVVDERGGTVFDSGLIDGGKSWSRHIPVESALRFKVYAVDVSGDVRVGEMTK